jgi:dihydroorotate dehydrogenase electron transfer subunit
LKHPSKKLAAALPDTPGTRLKPQNNCIFPIQLHEANPDQYENAALIQCKSTVRNASQISADFFELSFRWDGPPPSPGQFLTVRISELTAPLLRRPFAFSGFDPDTNTASMIYQRRGPATTLLAGLGLGESFDAIGPLGHGFALSPLAGQAILTAGGIGLGPILYLATELEKQGVAHRFIFGARNARAVPKLDRLNEMKPVVCTDDGSEGFCGTVVDYLRTVRDDAFADAALFCCGPNPMLKACHAFAHERHMPCQVSMEQVMACGVGACMGCVIKTTTEPGYARVCTEGPVFHSDEVVWS